MKWLAALLLSSAAYAAPITPPAGWVLDPSLVPPTATARFGGASTADILAYRAPSPGAVLFVNRAEAVVAAADRDRLATGELDEPRSALRRAGATAKAEQDSQQFDPAAKQLEANVRWRDASVVDATRMLVAGDDKRLVAVSGQCVLGADVEPALAKACEAALATLDTEIPVATRVALAIVRRGDGGRVEEGEGEAGGAADIARAERDVIVQPEPPPKPIADTIGDGGTSLPAIRVDAPAPTPDRRPVYLGGGMIVLAAVFWWNRKRREKFEAENAQEMPDRVPRATAKSKSRDEDADALHSAAEASDDRETK
jgi:hypothetical protein